ncbi:MAG: H-type small acid-soluble spore protein [Clostridiaceae bacterium]|nr:H-type small acid-soluble spore protein [Clostridiaceae bacterium]
MDFKRAEEIVKSAQHIEVLHNSKPVWINELHADKQTAEVQESLHPTAAKKEVPVNELKENGVIH